MMCIAKRLLPSGALALLVVLARPAALAADPAPFTWRTSRGVAFEVTSNGLSRITFEGRALATGEWSAFNAESWFCRGATNGPVGTARCQQQTLEAVSSTRAVVRQRK